MDGRTALFLKNRNIEALLWYIGQVEAHSRPGRVAAGVTRAGGTLECDSVTGTHCERGVACRRFYYLRRRQQCSCGAELCGESPGSPRNFAHA